MLDLKASGLNGRQCDSDEYCQQKGREDYILHLFYQSHDMAKIAHKTFCEDLEAKLAIYQ